MTMNKTNFHTHHNLCRHAVGNVEDYVLEAIKQGYSEIGLSDHGPIPVKIFTRMSEEEFEQIYLKEIDEAIIKYGDKIKIHKGLEVEFIYERVNWYKELLTKVDYLILGCHFYTGDETINDCSSYAINTKEKLESYTRLIEEGLKTGLFKILAHPDLFMIGYLTFDSFAEECSRRIIKSAIENDVIIELNANGFRKGKRLIDGKMQYAYPNDEFFKIVKEMNPKVIISSDCHKPELLDDEWMDKARAFGKDKNLNITTSIY